ncbi:MAG TPA: ferrous iron transport protein B, partial [bacterium]|nr:ferrous iron transport protein B [bacterium]
MVVVLDTCNLERTLYLLLLILEMGLKVVAVFNMFDRATEQGLEVDLERFSSSLSILCVATVAHRQIGISELKEAITQTLSRPVGFSPVNYGEKVSKLVRELEEAVRPFRPPYPAAYVALKLVEHDPEMTEWLVHNDVTGRIKMMLESLKAEIKEPETFFWERRCGFIHGLVLEATRLTGNRQARLDITERLDRILTHPWMGLFVFLILMALVFEVVFHWSLPFQFFLNGFFNLLGQAVGFLLQAGRSPAWLVSLVSDAIFHGVGSVVSFLPNIFLLFLFFSVLEESGYMARVAFVADPLMHPLGLHGRSAISMLLGFGCNVPAIMSTRTLESPRDRILTILVNPFMSCSARLPVYLVFSSVFFPRYQGMVVFSLYFMGLAMAGLTAKIFTLFWFKEQSAPLIMELPPYQMPVWRNVVASAWNRALLFLHKAGTIIFLAMVVVW